MNGKYWNDLSDEERKKVNYEWERSHWKSNALDDSENNVVLGTGYYILLVLSIFLIFIYKSLIILILVTKFYII